MSETPRQQRQARWKKNGSSDPREQAAGGRRVSSEDAGVWAFKMMELRVQEGKEERKIEREREIKLEFKGIKTGNKTIYKKSYYLLSAGRSVAATVIHLAERVC